MARETIHLVRAFKIGKGARLVAEAPVRCKSSDTAHRMGEKLAATMTGVVAFATSGDAELGGYDEEPTIIFKPAGFRPRSRTHEGAAAAPRSGHRP